MYTLLIFTTWIENMKIAKLGSYGVLEFCLFRNNSLVLTSIEPECWTLFSDLVHKLWMSKNNRVFLGQNREILFFIRGNGFLEKFHLCILGNQNNWNFCFVVIFEKLSEFTSFVSFWKIFNSILSYFWKNFDNEY